jgi:hypothetical protein
MEKSDTAITSGISEKEEESAVTSAINEKDEERTVTSATNKKKMKALYNLLNIRVK